MARKFKRKLKAARCAPVIFDAAYARESLFPELLGEKVWEKEQPLLDAAEAAWLSETKGW